MSSASAGPSGLSLEKQRALLREEQLRHVVDLMESDDDELLVQALNEVERQLAVPMDDEHLTVTEHRQRLHDDREAFARQNTPFFEEAPAQRGGGGHFRFVLDPIVERRSAVVGVRERIFRTRLEQQHRQRLRDDREAFARQNTPSFFEEAPAQGGGGGHFRFVLDTIVERRSAVVGVCERIFRTRLEQQGRLDSWRQNINHALAQGLRGAIETLLDDATIHDWDHVFLRFHSPRYDNSFS